jgi:hypothetical protein
MRLSEQERELLRRMGRAGGKIGGPARAESLSAARKRAIAKKAAAARWAKTK